MVYMGLSSESDRMRSMEWNRRYGKIEDIGQITTPVTLGREDDPNFKQQQISVTGESLLAREMTRRHMDRNRFNTDDFSAYDYFQGRDTGTGNLSFKRDYRNMSNLYAEDLTRKNAGLHNPDLRDLEKGADNMPKPAAPAATTELTGTAPAARQQLAGVGAPQ
jgi:hypothetical protein